MEKLLHERLRDIEESDVCTPEKLGYGENCGNTYCNKCEVDMFNALADEIERYYIPRPRFEDGEPVQFKERMGNGAHVRRIIFHEDGWTVDSGKNGKGGYHSYNSGIVGSVPRWKEPVLDADGVPCKPNDEVWSTSKEGVYEDDDMMIVVGIDAGVKERQVLVRRALGGAGEHWVNSEYLTHERPVFDADGVRIKRGDEVWRIHSKLAAEAGSLIVTSVSDECVYTDLRVDGQAIEFKPENLTHERPIFDAEGVRVCKGDTVWSTEVLTIKGTVTDIEYKVGDIVNVVIAGSLCEKYNFSPEKLTHREPDSLEKLRDNLKEHAEAVEAYAPDGKDGDVARCAAKLMLASASRLTALIERGA